MNTIFQSSMVLVMALTVFAIALLCIGIGLALLHASRNNSAAFFMPLLILVAAIGVTSVALSGRMLLSDFGAPISEASLMAVEGRLPAKLLLGLLVGMSLVALAGRLFQTRAPMHFPSALAASFVGFYATSNLVPAAFGYAPTFLFSLIYTPFVLTALFLSVSPDARTALRGVKAALLLIVVSSLIAAVVAPTLTLQNSEKALIPGYGMRLWGLTSHANVLGSFALTLGLIEWASPYERVAWHRLCLLSAVAALLWTQSKTSIVAAVIALLVILAFRSYKAFKDMNIRTRAKSAPGKLVPMIAVAMAMVIVLLLLIAVLFGDDLGVFRATAKRLAKFDLTTIQGRTIIWRQAITEGIKHPIFGYGLNLWGPEYRLSTGLTSAFHAHNQFLQVFSVAGVFGLLGFTVYLLVLGKMSIAVAGETRGVSLALFAVLLVRSLSEVPIQFGFSGELVSHLAFVLFVGVVYAEADRVSAVGSTNGSTAGKRPRRWNKLYARL